MPAPAAGHPRERRCPRDKSQQMPGAAAAGGISGVEAWEEDGAPGWGREILTRPESSQLSTDWFDSFLLVDTQCGGGLQGCRRGCGM